MNHVYEGHRTARGCSVSVNGEPLRHEEKHSPTGLEWGYGGSGPADTALSILTHHFGNRAKAERHYQQFKQTVVARLDRLGWILTSEMIDEWYTGTVRGPEVPHD